MTDKQIKHLLLHLTHVTNGKIYTLPEDDSMTDEEIKKSNFFNWGNENHYNEAKRRITQALADQRNQLIQVEEKKNQIDHSINVRCAELKVNKLFGDIGLLEPYGRLDNPNYVTPYEKTIEIIKQALVDQRTQLIQELRKEIEQNVGRVMYTNPDGTKHRAYNAEHVDKALKLVEEKE